MKIINESYKDEFDKLFTELVPSSGTAGNVAGELLRAVARIHYRYYNDGDKINYEYGRETTNPPARYILDKGSDTMQQLVVSMWSEDPFFGTVPDSKYESLLNQLIKEVIEYVNNNPQLRDEKSKDMWDYKEPEDEDWYPDEDEEDEWYDEDEDYDY